MTRTRRSASAPSGASSAGTRLRRSARSTARSEAEEAAGEVAVLVADEVAFLQQTAARLGLPSGFLDREYQVYLTGGTVHRDNPASHPCPCSDATAFSIVARLSTLRNLTAWPLPNIPDLWATRVALTGWQLAALPVCPQEARASSYVASDAPSTEKVVAALFDPEAKHARWGFTTGYVDHVAAAASILHVAAELVPDQVDSSVAPARDTDGAQGQFAAAVLGRAAYLVAPALDRWSKMPWRPKLVELANAQLPDHTLEPVQAARQQTGRLFAWVAQVAVACEQVPTVRAHRTADGCCDRPHVPDPLAYAETSVAAAVRDLFGRPSAPLAVPPEQFVAAVSGPWLAELAARPLEVRSAALPSQPAVASTGDPYTWLVACVEHAEAEAVRATTAALSPTVPPGDVSGPRERLAVVERLPSGGDLADPTLTFLTGRLLDVSTVRLFPGGARLVLVDPALAGALVGAKRAVVLAEGWDGSMVAQADVFADLMRTAPSARWPALWGAAAALVAGT